MADQKPLIQIDDDWKRQAQEEKRKLAEQEQKAKETRPIGAAPVAGAVAGTPTSRPGPRDRREIPPASFGSIVQTLMTQALFYLGDLAPSGGQPTLNLDMARLHIDMLGVLEEKTRNNLTADEQKMLDTALYEVRMRFTSVASQFIV